MVDFVSIEVDGFQISPLNMDSASDCTVSGRFLLMFLNCLLHLTFRQSPRKLVLAPG